MRTGIVELDLHGKTAQEAKRSVDTALGAAGKDVYRIRLIHGYHGGTGIKRMLWEEYAYGREPKVIRLEPGVNPGITELVLREF